MVAAAQTVRRRVVFLLPILVRHSGEEEERETFDALGVLDRIDALPKGQPRYVTSPEGQVYHMWVHRRDEAGALVSLGVIRHEDLPAKERNGDLEYVPLEEDEGLAEVTFFLLHESGVVSMVYNHFGPRPNRLARYLEELGEVGDGVRVTMEPVLRRDAVGALLRMKELRLLRCRIPAGDVSDIVEGAGDEGRALALLAQDAGDERVEVVIRAPRKKWLGKRWLDWLKQHVTMLQKKAEVLQVSGWDEEKGTLEAVDLLHDRMVVKEQFVRVEPKSRMLDPEDVWTKVMRAYRERLTELRAAIDGKF